MIVAMAQDPRVILIKLADRLHNMRTIEYLGRQKQLQKAKETLEVYAPIAHRLGIHAIKWELEDLAFERLHPRKYAEIEAMVAERRGDREEHVKTASRVLKRELEKSDIPADISGRAKHFYSIYDKMVRKGREFNEIYDLTAMRVIVERSGEEGTRDCYGALGLIHSLWKPMPGRFKDFIAMPKLNRYRALHTTVIGPEGKPLEIQIRTHEMHREAEFGIAAHWVYKKGKRGKGDEEWTAWMRQLIDWQSDEADPREFIKTFHTDLFSDEVYVFTPKGDVKTLPAGATPIDFAYAVHTDVGHRTVGAKVNGRIVPLHYQLKSGDFVEILTAKSGRGPSRDWLSLAASSRARNKIRQWFSRETREETEQKGRDALEQALQRAEAPVQEAPGVGGARAGDPRDRLQEGGGLLHRARLREAPADADRPQGHPAAEDRGGRRGRDGHAQADARAAGDEPERRRARRGRGRRARSPGQVLHARARRPHPRLHLARARHHDPPRGLPERQGAAAEPGAADAGVVGRRQLAELPRPGGRRLVGPPAPARGRRPDVRRARREHRRVRRCRRGSDGPEPLYRRARRREVIAGAAQRAAPDRRRLRRVSHDSPVSGCIHPTAEAGFSAAAEVYERARPGYPDEAVSWVAERLGIGPGRDVLDLAAGTGKLTRQLVPFGARIVAVEPIDAMRAELERAVPGVEALAGTAEAIPLADGERRRRHVRAGVPLVPRRTRRCGRSGACCVPAGAWRCSGTAATSTIRSMREWTSCSLPTGASFPCGEEHWRAVLGPSSVRTWRYSETLTRDEYVDRVASTSFVGAMEPAQRREFLNEVRDALSGFGEPLDLRYLTDVYVCEGTWARNWNVETFFAEAAGTRRIVR